MSLRGILRFIVLACFFATPFLCLIVPSSMFFPFITGKNFWFRILVEVMLGAWILLIFLDATYRPRFSWIFAAAGTFLAVIALADFTGVNPYRSFWSNYERMEGLITHIHLFLYFIIAGSVLLAEGVWTWFWRTSLGVSLLVAINAFAQLKGWGAVHQSSNRLDATFGNSVYLAMYALFTIFLATFLFFREGKKHPYARFIYPVIALINLVILYYTQTRGTLLGLVGGIFLALLLSALFDREHPERKKYAMGGVIGVLLLLGAFVAARDASWIQHNQTLSRMANISLTDPTTISRFMIWRMSWEGFKEHPILGWGQDNFLYVFGNNYDPGMWNQEPWFDRSHDVFFDWLIAGGALGLLAYLSLFGTALYYLWFSRRHNLSVVEQGVLTGMLAGYFVHNIFVFDNITSYLVFFAFLAYLHSQNVEVDAPSVTAQTHKKDMKSSGLESGDLVIAGVIVSLMTAGTIYFVNVRNMDANVDLISAIRPETVIITGANGQKEIALKGILERELFGSGEAREQLAQLAIQTTDPRVPENIRQQFYDLTSKEFEQEIARDPKSLRTTLFAASFYERFGRFDKALRYFNKAIELAPKHQTAYLDLSQMLIYQKDYSGAVKVAKIAHELDPKYPGAAIAYITALLYEKNIDEANNVLEKFRNDPILYDGRLINAFGINHYYGEIVELINEKIAKGSGVPRDYLTLAGAYSGLGENAKAAESIKKAISVDAGLKTEGEEMLAQLLKR